ncbi:MAG: TonB-dependent receptor [Bacteroidota bacterium]
MLRKIYFSIVTLLLAGTSAIAQNNGGAIKVLLKDKTNGETIPFANVVAYQGGVQVGVGTTDMDGYAMIKPLAPGKYDIKGVYVGYQAAQITGVVVGEAKTAYVTIELSNGEGVRLDEVQIIAYAEPLIDGDMKSGGTVTREEYQNMATKNINSVAATTAGVYQADEGGALSVRGGRSSSTIYFVDGVKVIGGLGVPQQGVEQLNVITGGVPAQYGDATSGIISVTTRGPQSKFFGGVELISSQLTDKYGYNSLGFSIGGPILQKKDSTGHKEPKIGFFLSGQGTYEKDPAPSFVKMWKLTDSKLAELEKNPLRVVTIGSDDIFIRELDYVTKADMVQTPVRQNVASRSIQLNGKLDFKLAPNTNLTLGGAFDYGNAHDFTYVYSLFNPQNNPQTINTTWRTYARINQKFGTNQTATEKEKSQALISNAYFTFLASYEKSKSKTQDDTHKDKIFNYGYQGKYNFTVDTTSNYGVEYDDTTNTYFLEYKGRILSPITYQRSELNPTTANYSSQVFNYKGTEESIQAAQGDYAFVNGDRPQSINGLFASTGRQYNGYGVTESTQLRFASSFSADFKNHAIMVGVEYDQRNQSGYQVLPIELWRRMRELSNLHLQTFDKENPIIIPGTPATAGLDQYYYRYVYDADNQTQIDKSLREALGLSADNQTYINTDAFSPDDLKLSMFSAQDLLQSGVNPLVDYYGYDYLGNKDKNSTNLDKFLNDKDDKGNQTLHVGAYKPIYVAGYIQDKFDFKDLKFNVGVRVDRFDANQKVLKDPYLFQEAYTASEKAEGKPENIKGDYVVYVDNLTSLNVVGYRHTDEKTQTTTWYNSEGIETSDPKTLVSDGKLTPWLKDADYAGKNAFSTAAFRDYKPQINVMPRVAFSFPISDVANFFAHYDVLTQRPSDGLMRFDPKDYYFINSTSSSPFITNSNLKPEKTIDYEIGYNQVLNQKKNAALKITAFYRELRNQITLVSLTNAYPKTYQTYANKDFGTVKGLSAEFDLRRTGGVSLTANYTLQFAEGSGSNANSGANLSGSDQPNLRITLPLDYDQRHTITLNFDYRFGEGKDYKGPQFNRKKKGEQQTVQVFQNVGANLIFRIGSGTPYTRDIAASPIGGRAQINGSVNGSYKPWQFRTDLRIDKNIALTWGKKDSDNKKTANLNIYLQVLNLLNTRNILGVYNYTGNPDDDGYLASAQGQLYVNSNPTTATSFTDQYNIYINNPSNYGRPRTIRIGVLLDF